MIEKDSQLEIRGTKRVQVLAQHLTFSTFFGFGR